MYYVDEICTTLFLKGIGLYQVLWIYVRRSMYILITYVIKTFNFIFSCVQWAEMQIDLFYDPSPCNMMPIYSNHLTKQKALLSFFMRYQMCILIYNQFTAYWIEKNSNKSQNEFKSGLEYLDVTIHQKNICDKVQNSWKICFFVAHVHSYFPQNFKTYTQIQRGRPHLDTFYKISAAEVN